MRGKLPFLGSHLVLSLKLPALVSNLSFIVMTFYMCPNTWIVAHVIVTVKQTENMCETCSQDLDFWIEIDFYLKNDFKSILENVNLIKIFILSFGILFLFHNILKYSLESLSSISVQKMCLNRLFKSQKWHP